MEQLTNNIGLTHFLNQDSSLPWSSSDQYDDMIVFSSRWWTFFFLDIWSVRSDREIKAFFLMYTFIGLFVCVCMFVWKLSGV